MAPFSKVLSMLPSYNKTDKAAHSKKKGSKKVKNKVLSIQDTLGRSLRRAKLN
jgi:hypothetical protein